MTFSGSGSVERAFALRTLDEAGQLAVFLDAHRAILRASLEGMTDDEVRARLVPSKTTLLGLVKHATFMQVVWYQEAISGTPRTRLGQPAAVDDSFALAEADSVDSVLAGYDQACATAREVGAMHGLDEVVNGHRMGAMTLRWIHLQVLRELAQHSGHADILREQLLADRAPRRGTYGQSAGAEMADAGQNRREERLIGLLNFAQLPSRTMPAICSQMGSVAIGFDSPENEVNHPRATLVSAVVAIASVANSRS